MKIQGEHRFAAPRQEVWEALLDPEVLARTVPGSQGLERTGDNAFQGELKIKVGPVQGVFQGKVTLDDLKPPASYTLKLDGRGAPGFVNGTGGIVLEDDPDGGTLLRYDVVAQVGGRIAGVGQRLLDSSAKVITRQALEALDAQVQARWAAKAPGSAGRTGSGACGAEAASAPGEQSAPRGEGSGAAPSGPSSRTTAAGPPAPSTARFAAGVVRGVVADLVPPRHRRKVVVAGVGIAAFLVLIGLRSCA